MSELPQPVAEAGLLFQRSAIISDDAAMRRIIEWGHQQIDVFYPEDPLRAPLNLFRRKLAHMEWDRVIRTQGRELRGMIASTMVKELEFELERRRQEIQAQDTERRRRDGYIFDMNMRIEEHERVSRIDLDNDLARMRSAHNLQEQSEDAASERRIDERINETEQEITKMISQAVYESMGTSSAQEVLDLVGKVSAEVTRIRKDTDLSNDDKHLHIKTLLDSLPLMLRRAHES